VVATAFSQRRKTLRNTLAGLVSKEAFEHLGIDPGLRAENLALADYENIARYLAEA
ncbi:MAG: 16S rRNA (adenine(1518)-N(6)/adenine(1519)-N(6))-dimethyltransferase, partial [Deltaproteobacteria bacterium]